MSKFQELQDQHIKLLQSYERHKESPQTLKEVREYTEQVVNNSREIGNTRERNQLRANLRFWGAYIYEHTGTYPNLNLLPSEVSPATPAPKTTSAIWIIPIALIFLVIVLLGRSFPLTVSLSQAPDATLTSISTGLFVTPYPSVENPMSLIEEFATGTAMALLTRPAADPATVTVAAALTQAAVSTQPTIATPTVPSALGGVMSGHAYSQTEIQDDISCSSHRINIVMSLGFASDKSIEPATLTISEEGTFRKIAERQIPLQAGEVQSNGNEEIKTEIDIPEANGSYLIYIGHPKFTFDAVIVQHLPDCHGNHNIIKYDIPVDDYENLESRPDLGVNFGLLVWGPYPAIDPDPVRYGVAKIQVNSEGNAADHIFWIWSGNPPKLNFMQNNEFIAYSFTDNYVGVTSGGRTVSIPFILRTPYVDYLQHK